MVHDNALYTRCSQATLLGGGSQRDRLATSKYVTSLHEPSNASTLKTATGVRAVSQLAASHRPVMVRSHLPRLGLSEAYESSETLLPPDRILHIRSLSYSNVLL
jgi:hypothetical protein